MKIRQFLMALVAVLVAIAASGITTNTVAPPQAGTSIETGGKALIEELVIANHILANERVVDAYGHVSVRSPTDPNRFLLARQGPPGLVTADAIVEYDLDSKPVQSAAGSAGYSERFIHGEIYRARPDVMAVVHCHAPDVIPFSVSSVRLLPIVHVAGFLGDGIPTFEIRDTMGVMSDMLVSNGEIGKALAKTLGDEPAALMRGHGAVIVAPSLHVVVGRAYYMNFNAGLLLQALRLGGDVKYLDPEEARRAAPQDGFERAWTYWKERARK